MGAEVQVEEEVKEEVVDNSLETKEAGDGEEESTSGEEEKEEKQEEEIKEETETETKKEEVVKPTVEEVVGTQGDEIRELRQVLRDSKREKDGLTAQLDKFGKILKDANLMPEGEEEDAASTKLAKDTRDTQLENLLEIMKVNPKFEDVDEVVSQANFDDMIEVMAEAYVKENGGNVKDVIPEIEAGIWGMPNPYKFMYKEIKENHPNYGGKTRTATPLKGATSVSSLGGGSGSDQEGWTAKRIDNMPEEELNTVPKDVYSKYLKGLLK